MNIRLIGVILRQVTLSTHVYRESLKGSSQVVRICGARYEGYLTYKVTDTGKSLYYK